MSLNEKAKTLEQLEKIASSLHDELTWGKQKPFCNIRIALSHQESNQKSAEYHSDLWVRLEDARQEIDKLKDDCKEKSEGYAKVCARLHERIMDLERERGEQKQKLQRLKLKFSEIEAIIWAICEPDSLGYTILEEFKKEFGELIKETK